MPASPQAFALQTCFHYLLGMQTACAFNTSALAMDPFHFAKATISAVVPAAYQASFLQAATQNTGLPFNQKDLSLSTFLDLLNAYRNLESYVGQFLQSLAVNPYPAGSLANFLPALTTDAFPGGSNGGQWKLVVVTLTAANPQIMPPSCFSTQQQIQAGIALDAPGATMASAVKLIAGLG
jgi:hypothetical protein